MGKKWQISVSWLLTPVAHCAVLSCQKDIQNQLELLFPASFCRLFRISEPTVCLSSWTCQQSVANTLFAVFQHICTWKKIILSFMVIYSFENDLPAAVYLSRPVHSYSDRLLGDSREVTMMEHSAQAKSIWFTGNYTSHSSKEGQHHYFHIGPECGQKEELYIWRNSRQKDVILGFGEQDSVFEKYWACICRLAVDPKSHCSFLDCLPKCHGFSCGKAFFSATCSHETNPMGGANHCLTWHLITCETKEGKNFTVVWTLITDS